MDIHSKPEWEIWQKRKRKKKPEWVNNEGEISTRVRVVWDPTPFNLVNAWIKSHEPFLYFHFPQKNNFNIL